MTKSYYQNEATYFIPQKSSSNFFHLLPLRARYGETEVKTHRQLAPMLPLNITAYTNPAFRSSHHFYALETIQGYNPTLTIT